MGSLGDMFPPRRIVSTTSGRWEESDLSTAQEFCEQAFSEFQPTEVSNPDDEPDLCFDGVPSSRSKKGLTASERRARDQEELEKQQKQQQPRNSYVFGRNFKWWHPGSWMNLWRWHIFNPMKAHIKRNPW